MSPSKSYQRAAAAIRSAKGLMIGAGAGMGVDSGLPDFRGPEGFWKAYPPFRGREFSEMSTPHWFRTDPQLAWGFFGHRMNLYRSAIPHAGFEILQKWAGRLAENCFVFTSNVDGQFQKAGFPESSIVECHGSIHRLQCSKPCSKSLWSSSDLQIEVDSATIRTSSELPSCPACGGISRPNILMFDDSHWVDDRTKQQWRSWQTWLQKFRDDELVIVELGAGVAVPTIRLICESQRGLLIRINPRDAGAPDGAISLSEGALTALQKIDALLTD